MEVWKIPNGITRVQQDTPAVLYSKIKQKFIIVYKSFCYYCNNTSKSVIKKMIAFYFNFPKVTAKHSFLPQLCNSGTHIHKCLTFKTLRPC